MTRPPLLTRDFGLLTVAHLLQALGYSTMVLLPLYLTHLGASHGQVGTIMATSAVGGLALRPATGWALDALGRKPVLVAGTVALVAGMGMVGLIDRLGPLVYLHRLVLGAGVGALFTGYFALASDLIPATRRTEGIALFGISGLLPLALNAFVGGLGIEGGLLRWFFPAVGGVIAVSFAFFLPVRETPVDRARAPVRLAEVGRALGTRAMRPVWLATVVFAGMLATFMAFVTVAAESRGVAWPAGLWLTYAAGAVMVRLFGARLPDRVGPANLVAPALAVYTGAMLLAAGASDETHFLLAGLLGGLGHGYCFPVLTSQVVTRAPERLRGSALASFTAIWDVSALALTPAFGLFADWTDDRSMFSLAAVCAVVGLVGWMLLERGALTPEASTLASGPHQPAQDQARDGA